MQVHPPPLADVLASVAYLVIFVMTARFALRWFLGVRALQRQCEQQAWMLKVLAHRLGVELPAAALPAGRFERMQRLLGAARSRAAAWRTRRRRRYGVEDGL